MDPSMTLTIVGVLIIGGAMLALMTFGKKSPRLDVEYYRTKILEIEHYLKDGEPASYALCVINGDKLVDKAMKARQLKGQTMGDKMKNSASLFSDLNGFWQAHKLRNKIAHEPDFHISYQEARVALRSFRQALKDLGAI